MLARFLGIAAMLAVACPAAAAPAAYRLGLHCTGKTTKGRPVERWLSINGDDDSWCLRRAANGPCKLMPYHPDDDATDIEATQDDPDTGGYQFQIDRRTGAYYYEWEVLPKNHPEDEFMPIAQGSERGRCTVAPFTPYTLYLRQTGHLMPPPPGRAF